MNSWFLIYKDKCQNKYMREGGKEGGKEREECEDVYISSLCELEGLGEATLQ